MGRNILSIFFISLIFLHKYEFSITIAIDVGSDTYKIALTRPGNYMELVLNPESNRKTLNTVGFSPKERYVGDSAYNSARKHPESTFRHPNFLLGSSYNSSLMNLYRRRFPLVDLKKHNVSENIIFSAKNFKEEFSPEALVSMILTDAQMSTKAFIKSTVKDIAVVVRAFTDQTQRYFYKKSAEIAKMRLVEIIDSNVAVGVRYLISKMDKLSNIAQNVMIIDVGAYHTDATIYSCQELFESKNKKKPYPSCTIIGYGYTLKGVSEIDSIIMDIIINKFERKTKIKYSTIGNARRNFTLLEEAKRIKKFLTSVNSTRISLESFYQDEDFYDNIEISEVESYSKDYVESMLGAIDQSFKSSNVSINNLTQVVLMGGGSRVPMVQSIIKQKTGMERLSNILNTDEDAVLGATFILASKSNFFKVKKIDINKAAIYPIVVSYNKTELQDDGSMVDKHVEKILYNHMQSTTQGKILTIKNVTRNLSLYLKYGKIPSYYDKEFIKSNHILCKYDINGVEDAVDKYKENYYLEMIRVHASYDRFGIVSITSAEAVFHKKGNVSTFDRLKEKVSNLFVGKKEDDDNSESSELSEDIPDSNSIEELNSTIPSDINTGSDENKIQMDEDPSVANNTNETQPIHHNVTINSHEVTPTPANATKIDDPILENPDDNNTVDATTTTTTTTPAPAKKLVKKFKHHLSILSNKHFHSLPTDTELSHYQSKIGSIRKQEIQREQNAAAMSKLESFINECKYNLEDDGKFFDFVNDEEKTRLFSAINEKSAWFDDNGYTANATVNNRMRKDLNETFAFVYDRIHERDIMENLVKLATTIIGKMNDFVGVINNSTVSIKERFNMTSFDIFVGNLQKLKKMTTDDYDEWKKLKPWEAKPFNPADVSKLIEEIQKESIEHITVFSNINKEIEKKMKEEEKRKKDMKDKEKEKEKDQAAHSNSTQSLDTDNFANTTSTNDFEPDNLENSTTTSNLHPNDELVKEESSEEHRKDEL